MLCGIKVRRNINIHGLQETAGYINKYLLRRSVYIGLNDEQKVRHNKITKHYRITH